MRSKSLFALWGGLFIVCAGLGFIPNPAGAARAALTAVSVAFFVPPALLLRRGVKEKNIPMVRRIRNLAALSLGMTLGLLVLNFLSALRSRALGNVLYGLLIVVSSPMVCSGFWVLSLFLWACLLMVSLSALRKIRNGAGKP